MTRWLKASSSHSPRATGHCTLALGRKRDASRKQAAACTRRECHWNTPQGAVPLPSLIVPRHVGANPMSLLALLELLAIAGVHLIGIKGIEMHFQGASPFRN